MKKLLCLGYRWQRLAFVAGMSCRLLIAAAPAPPSYDQTATEQQLRWHEMEFYGLLHFGLNTFVDQEWSHGDVSPTLFDPKEFDAEIVAQTMKEAGMKGIVLVCKHHDGFCLWPSRYTDYSVKGSPWKNGRGDVVREISEACRRKGLKFGVYLSPWDRNSKDYGRPEYLAFYRGQLSELLTNYGNVFIAWFDGAQGGEGYYDGAREIRKIDNRTYYDWPAAWALVRKFQPDAVIFSDAGPDVRWVGNEHGAASDPCWYTINLKDCYPGMPDYRGLGPGLRSGTDWVPPECDVSIRPGWFYHAKEDTWVKSADRLVDIYYRTVGLGACLNLNVALDKTGQIPPKDAQELLEMGRRLRATFAVNLAHGAKVIASNVRGHDRAFAAENLLDGDRNTYWSTDDEVKTPEVVLDFGKRITFNVVRIREFLPLGQRVEGFALDSWHDGQWKEFFQGMTIGNQRLARIKPSMTSEKLRLRITQSPVCPALSELSVFLEPQLPALNSPTAAARH
jgi:alpha-L-fucosidase